MIVNSIELIIFLKFSRFLQEKMGWVVVYGNIFFEFFVFDFFFFLVKYADIMINQQNRHPL